jgi:hypothetical protein
VTRIVSMLKEASARRQIMATTHSVEMVKHAGLEDILSSPATGTGSPLSPAPRTRKRYGYSLRTNSGSRISTSRTCWSFRMEKRLFIFVEAVTTSGSSGAW